MRPYSYPERRYVDNVVLERGNHRRSGFVGLGIRSILRLPQSARLVAVDADDRATLARLSIYALLLVLGLVLVGFGLGLGVRAFLIGSGL